MKKMYRYLMLSLVFFVSSCEAETSEIFQQTYPVCVVGYNYHSQRISSFKILDFERCGGSSSGKEPGSRYGGGGGYSCGCGIERKKYLTVEWRYAMSYDEAQAGKKREIRQAKAILPPPDSSSSRYLELHFLEDNRVVIDWRDDQGASRVDPKAGIVKK